MHRLDDARIIHRRDESNKQPMMQIALRGETINQWLPGACLEEAFSSPNGDYLVFSTDDCPYEEGLNIILLSSKGHLLDVKTIACPYATGYLHDVHVENPQTIRFSFYASDQWQAVIPPGALKPRPQWVPRVLWRGLRVERLVR